MCELYKTKALLFYHFHKALALIDKSVVCLFCEKFFGTNPPVNPVWKDLGRLMSSTVRVISFSALCLTAFQGQDPFHNLF